ncbi:MAG: hypothetical protein KF718_32490 [Polyangiaceae bacterium]|nr:hypothetical protein [Polyangiaceae bacterium]
MTLLILLLGLVLLTSRTYADPEPRPEHRYLELGARVDARIADCPSDCDALPPGFGLSGFLGVRMHHHVAAGFTIEGARTPPTLGGFGAGIAITAVPF